MQFRMPEEYKSSWADEVELDSGMLPPPTETTDARGNKILTEYKFNKDGKKVKVVRTYKVTKHKVSKSAARRKKLPKFGDSEKDSNGPNPHTTFVSEDIMMQLITSKEEEKSNDTVLDPKSRFSCANKRDLPLNINLFQINLSNVVSVTADISRRAVLTVTLLRTSKRYSIQSLSTWQQSLQSLASTFHLSSRINRETLKEIIVMTPRPSAFPIFPSRLPRAISKISRKNLARNRKCFWEWTRTPDSARALPTSTSTTRKTQRLQSRHSTDLATIT